MNTFETTLDPVNWTEILQGGTYVAFDIVAAVRVEYYMNESGTPPSTSLKGNQISSWPNSIDFEASGLDAGVQRIWVRGSTDIRGYRD